MSVKALRSLAIVCILGTAYIFEANAEVVDVREDRKEAFEKLLERFPRGVESQEACLRAYSSDSRRVRAVFYELTQNATFDQRYEVTAGVWASRVISKNDESFYEQSCSYRYKQIIDENGKPTPMTIGSDLEAETEKWRSDRKARSCETWNMSRTGQAISYIGSNGIRASYPNSTCNCVVGACSFQEIFNNGATYDIVVKGWFENGSYHHTESYRQSNDASGVPPYIVVYRDSFTEDGRLLASYRQEDGYRSVSFHLPELVLDDDFFPKDEKENAK